MKGNATTEHMAAVIDVVCEHLLEQSDSDEDALFAATVVSLSLYTRLKKGARKRALQKMDKIFKEMNL